MKATIDQSPFHWQRWYSGVIEADNAEYEYTVKTQETEQTAEEIIEVEWVGQQPPIEIRATAYQEVVETWTEQHYAHYKRPNHEKE